MLLTQGKIGFLHKENEVPIGAFFSFRGVRGTFQQMFTFVIGISCGNTPFVQKHESTTHVNGFVFDSIFSAGKYFVRMFHAHRVCKPKPVFIRKKEKFPLELRCFLNNNKVLCKLCLRIKL